MRSGDRFGGRRNLGLGRQHVGAQPQEAAPRVRHYAALLERIRPSLGAIVDDDQERPAILGAAGRFDTAFGQRCLLYTSDAADEL